MTAGFYARDNMKAADLKKNWGLLIVLAAVAAVAILQLEPRSFLDRLGWWRAALGMFADRPWGPGNNPKTAAREYLKSHPEFVVDTGLDHKLQISVAPEGFLRRVS